MGVHQAADPAGQARRQQAQGGRVRGDKRADVCAEHWLPVARDPKDLPPRSTVNVHFCRWQHDGTLDRLHHALYVRCREQADRAASPTAAIIDSQSVKSAGKGAPARSAGL